MHLNDGWKGFPRTDTTMHDVMVGAHEESAGSRSSLTASVQAGGGGIVPRGGIFVVIFGQRPWTMDTLPMCPSLSMSTRTMKTTDDGGGGQSSTSHRRRGRWSFSFRHVAPPGGRRLWDQDRGSRPHLSRR